MRKSIKTRGKTLVIKLSSLAVSKPEGGIDKKKIKEICQDIAILKKEAKILVVCSGAVNTGRPHLKKEMKNEVSFLQACASIGQPLLMEAINKELLKQNLISSQVLLTHDDLKNKSRSFNIHSTIDVLLENGIIPIINENDSVSFDEITLGDNDQLSAMICELTGADILCMLTQADGLYDKDPKEKDANHFDLVAYDKEFNQIDFFKKTNTGKGGMRTKLLAVRKLTPLGIDVLISTFNKKSPILRALKEGKGTYFQSKKDQSINKKKTWILPRVKTDRSIIIDKGASEALLKNASLLPIGITKTKGNFNRADAVSIVYKDKVIAYGVSEYSSKDIEKIKKVKSSDLDKHLDHVPSKVVIHKNNLILKNKN